MESELFGYVKGAFTGATQTRLGRLEQAQSGTLFLDEIGDLDLALQTKMLRVLQEREFSPVGSDQVRKVDVRILAATNRDLKEMVREGRFREDLFYRLDVYSIVVPPLRERREDVPLLARVFLHELAADTDKPVHAISPEALAVLARYNWPGNIRELENYLKRYVILDAPDAILTEMEERERGPVVGGYHLPRPTDFSLKKFSKLASQQAEHYLILEALRQTRWNRKRAAELLEISYRALLYKIKEAGLPQKKKKSSGRDGVSPDSLLPRGAG